MAAADDASVIAAARHDDTAYIVKEMHLLHTA